MTMSNYSNYSLLAVALAGMTGWGGFGFEVQAGTPLAGQVLADPDRPAFLKRHGGGSFFVCGPGDPEGFLYRGTRRADGTRDGDQAALIRRLLEHGGNCLYVQAVRSHGGDGAPDHNPFIDHDPSKGLNGRVLDQWEEWFSLLDAHGVLVYFFIYDDGSKVWETGDAVGVAERRLVEGLVNRFKHHRHWIWVVAEESEEALSPARAAALARVIRAADDHGHLIGNHHHSGTTFKTFEVGGPFDHFAMQLNVPLAEVYDKTREALTAASGKYQLIYAENTETPQTVDGWRRQAWTVAMAGAMPMLLGMDVATTPVEALQQCRVLSEFFEDTDFPGMRAAPALARGATRHVLQEAGVAFIAWSDRVPGGAAMELAGVADGDYELLWLDCRTGRRLERAGSVSGQRASFVKPGSIGEECALHGRRVTAEAAARGVYPGRHWEYREPAAVGLSAEKLEAFARMAGGRGCVVRDGYMVFKWGDETRPADIASASKPIYSHLLLRAIEAGKLESADDPVLKFQPCLNDLNPALGHKDRGLTFRHLAFQTACLGYREAPGNAYDYNDHTMGFFWDTLVNRVYGLDWKEARDRLFAPELIEALQFEDAFDFPTEGRTRGRPRISPRDFARVGLLYLNRGRWRDRQVLSERHARLAATDPLPLTVPRTAGEAAERCATRSIGGGGNQTDHNGGYSWLWWVNGVARDGRRWWPDAPADMFCALGHCGQRGLAVLPAQRLIVSWNDTRELHCERELGNRAFRTLAEAAHR